MSTEICRFIIVAAHELTGPRVAAIKVEPARALPGQIARVSEIRAMISSSGESIFRRLDFISDRRRPHRHEEMLSLNLT